MPRWRQVGPEEVSAADKETNQKVLGYLSEFAALPTPTVRANFIPSDLRPSVHVFLWPSRRLQQLGCFAAFTRLIGRLVWLQEGAALGALKAKIGAEQDPALAELMAVDGS